MQKTKTLVQNTVSVAKLESALKHKLNGQPELLKLAEHPYVVLCGINRDRRIRLYYHVSEKDQKGNGFYRFGSTPYPHMTVSPANVRFNLATIVALSTYLGHKMPFGTKLVYAMEQSVVPLDKFQQVVEDYYKNLKAK